MPLFVITVCFLFYQPLFMQEIKIKNLFCKCILGPYRQPYNLACSLTPIENLVQAQRVQIIM